MEQDIFVKDGPFDRDNPKSLYNIMPREAKITLDEIPATWLYMDEQELSKVVRPTPFLNQVRSAFWQEYDLAQSSNTKMTLKGVILHMGNNSPSILVRDAFASTKKLAWILHPPMHYDALIDEALSHGMRRIQEILQIPLYNEDGKLDHKAADIIMKATAFLDIRKNGMPTQRTEMRQLTVNVTKKDMAQLGMQRPDEIDKKIKQLEAQLAGEDFDG